MSITLEDYLKDAIPQSVAHKDLEVGEFYIIKHKNDSTVIDNSPVLAHIGKLIDNAKQQPRVKNPDYERYPHVGKYLTPVTHPYFYIYSFAHKRAPSEIDPANKYRVEEDFRNPSYYNFYKLPFKIKETEDTEGDSISKETFTILEPSKDTDSSEKAGGKKRKTKKGKRGKKSKDSRKKSKSKRKNRK
jgi:hypothetical protein